MSEVLRDLVVSLSLNTDNFTRNINSINRQIREAESSFKLAGAGVDNFANTNMGLTSRMALLQTTLDRQKEAVTQYEGALAQADTRMQDSYARYTQYTAKLEDAKARHIDLGTAASQAQARIADLSKDIIAQEEWMEQVADAVGTDCDAYRAEEAILEQLRTEYAENAQAIKDYVDSGKEIEKLTAQCDALQKSTQRAADSVTAAQTNLNNAKAAVKETEGAIRKLNQQIDAHNNALKPSVAMWLSAGTALTSFSGKMKSLGASATKLGRRMTMVLTTPIVALGKKIVQSTLDFEDSFALVRKTVDATEEQFNQLAEASKRMSTQVAMSTTEINQVMATGGQLGIATENIEDFARVMIDLSKASTDLDADTAATQLAKFANIMGTDQSMFSNIGSTIAQLGNNFATTEAPIAEMAMRLAGAGKQAGLTEAEVLGLATALSSVGIKAQAGGSSMSKALIQMEVAAREGGQALADFAKVCGVTKDQFIETWDADPVHAFQLFIEGLAKLDDEGASAIVTLNDIGISEIRLRDTMLRATNATELFSRAQKMANEAWSKNTALEEKASKRYATLESRLTNLKNRAVLFGQTLGDDLRPTIENVMESIHRFIDRLQEMDAGQRMQIMRSVALAAAAGPVILIFGRLATATSKITGVLGAFCTAVGKAGGGMKGFLIALTHSPAMFAAVAAAAVYGTYKFIDWASGAKQAREATQALIDTAKEWKETAAETFYTANDAGLSFFGISKDDFKSDKTATSAKAWLAGLIEVWTDGKGETNEIVKTWTESWRGLTAATRTGLEELQTAAVESGHTGVAEQIQKDIDSLDSMDREIGKLLKKRQNGYLTEDEKIHLQELIDTRDSIIVKYKLQPDAETGNFQTIINKVQAEVARSQAKGLEDASISVYQNAVVAAAQGLAVMNQELDDQYDKEYAVIQLMEDGAEKEKALAELDKNYNERRLETTREYAATLAQLVMPVWESGSMQETGSTLADLATKLTAYDFAVKSFGENSVEASDALKAIEETSKGLSEGNLTEYATVLTQISELLSSGMSMEEVQALFPDIDVSTALEQLASIQEFTSTYSSALSGLSSMFGEGLSEEVLRIATELDMSGAQANWDAFAADPGAITTEAIIANVQETEEAKHQQIKVDAVVKDLITTDGETGKHQLTISGVLAYVNAYAEAVTGADTSALTPDHITAMVNAYEELASGADVSELKPDDITAYIIKYLENNNVDTTGLTPDAVTAFVLAYEEISGGARTTDLAPDDITAYVYKYLEGANIDSSSLAPSDIIAIVSAYKELANGADISTLTPDEITAEVSRYMQAAGIDISNLTPEGITATVAAYQEIEGGALKNGLTPGDIAAYVVKYLEAGDVDVSKLQPNQIEALVSLYSEATGCDKDSLAQALTGYISSYDDSSAAVPAPTTKLSITDYEMSTLNKTLDGNPIVVTGILRLGELYENPTDVLDEDNAKYYYNGEEIAVNLVPADKLTAETIVAYDEDGTLHINITPEIGSSEALEEIVEQYESTPLDNTHFEFLSTSIHDSVTEINEATNALNEYKQSMEEAEAAGTDTAMNGMQSYYRNRTAEIVQMIDDLVVREDDMDAVSSLALNLWKALSSEELDETTAQEYAAQLKEILSLVEAADEYAGVGNELTSNIAQSMQDYGWTGDAETLADALRTAIESVIPTVGNDAGAGVGQGMSEYDFSGDAGTAASNLEGAWRDSMESHSPAERMVPAGKDVAAGVGKGLSEYDYSGDSTASAASLMTAISSALSAELSSASNSAKSVGTAISSGIVSGIRAGRAGVITAAVSIAQAAVTAMKTLLGIRSPSRVFRDEIGLMAIKGIGEGFQKGEAEQARIIQNAARYLTEKAQGSIVTGVTRFDNRKTYEHNSNINLTGNNFYVRDDEDVYSLAVEIAALTKRQQRGIGARLA